jgi:hypothetical protein
MNKGCLPHLILLLLAGAALAAAMAAGCTPQPLELRRPWSGGEITVMEIKKNGSLLLYCEMLVEQTRDELVFTVEHLSKNYPQTVRVIQNPESMLPRRTEFLVTRKEGPGSVLAEYGAKAVQIKKDLPGEQGEKSLRLPAPPYFDNEQYMLLVRALPLAEGWKGSLNLIVIPTGVKVTIGLEVVRREQVTVPAGTFDAYVVELKRANQWTWVAVEPPYPVLRHENKNAGTVMELAEFFPQGRD